MKKLIAAFAAAGIITAHGAAYAWQETPPPTAPAQASPKKPSQPSAELQKWGSCATCLKTTLPSALPEGAAAFSAGQNMALPGDQLAIAISKPKPPPSALPDPRFSGGETDVAVLYAAPLDEKTTGVVSLSLRHDAEGISGQRDTAGIIQLKRSF
jgi:hypothetical protein